MKLRKLARQLAATAVAGAMALSFCMPALAETWDMSNTEKYPNGKDSWISVARYADVPDHPELNGQFLTIWYSGGEDIKQKDEAPVLSGSFETLGLNCYDGTTVHAALQDAHIEYNAGSEHTLTTSGKVELTLSGSNTVTHNNTYKSAIYIDDDSNYHNSTPGLLTIKGSGSLTATNNLSNGIRIDKGTLDVTDGTVNVTAAENGIDARGNTVQVSGGTLRVTATGEHGRGIDANYNGNITVSGGTLCATATGEHGTGIDASNNGKVTVSGGTLCATATGEHGTGIDASNNGKVTVSGGTLTASGGNFGIAMDQLEMSGGTLNASATSANGTVAITGKSIAVNGGVLNLKNNAAPDGIISTDLKVTNGRLTAKGQTVSANSITVSGGWVEADTLGLKATDDASSRTIDLSGGNVKLKNMPVGTVTFSGSARLTIDKTVSLADITALAEAFRSGSTTQSAYLKYIPANPAELPEGAVMEGSYAVLHGKDFPDEGPVYGDEPSGESTDIGTAPAGDAGGAGGAIAAVALGGAAVWGGYEVATRVILHKLLPEGAAIPKTQAQLAVLLWNTAGQPEPANAPAFADVDAATAKAAQWCTEQGYLSGTFKPDKRVAKYNVIRTWNKAFPKH